MVIQQEIKEVVEVVHRMLLMITNPEASGYIYSGDPMSDMGGSEIMIGEVQKKHNPSTNSSGS